jgi:hypothetical protein
MVWSVALLSTEIQEQCGFGSKGQTLWRKGETSLEKKLSEIKEFPA